MAPDVPASPAVAAPEGAGCPVPSGTAVRGCPRKAVRADDAARPAFEHRVTAAGERWVVRSFAAARTVLRAEDAALQAGFGAEDQQLGDLRRPILYLDGPDHRAQRSATARYFAPKVTEGYRSMMETFADKLLTGFDAGRPVDLTRLSLQMAVRVAGQVIGLTDSPPGLTRRLEGLFRTGDAGPGPVGAVLGRLRRLNPMVFFALDVKPAIRARRKYPREDVISELIKRGFSDLEILTEALTFGAAGMATTREFISVAAWHLLDDDGLRAHYLAADATERQAVLAEILRVEPVVGHLYRRTTEPLTLTDGDETVELPAGTLVDLDLRAVNAEAALVGADPLVVAPGRELPRGVGPSVLSFGDGHHRCPGNAIALLESDILLSRLLARDLEVVQPPQLHWNDFIESYEIRGFVLRDRAGR